MANAVYGSADGLLESPVVAMTSDEAQNRWVATNDALYLLAPGAASFHRYDQNDGLHFAGNPVHYCYDHPVATSAACPAANESWGEGKPPGITALAGGGPGEVFVGYAAIHPDGNDCGHNGNGEDWCDPDRHTGKIDRVRLKADGTLEVDRFDLVAINHGGKYWHDRSIERLLFDHLKHPHTLYSGSEHGVTMFLPDKFRLPAAGEWFNDAYKEWMGDHLHARVCFEHPCDASGADQRMGDWRGLALDASGNLWHAGRWTAGLITFDPDPVDWFSRNGAAFAVAFGDPYGGPGVGTPPVFPVAKEGHSVYLTGVAVCPDGRVWFGSSGPDDGLTTTLAVYDGSSFTYLAASQVGLPETTIRDLVCLPDGRLAIASFHSGLVLYDPATGSSTAIRAGPLIPSDGIESLDLDTMPDPPTLHVATDRGAAALRVLP
ncbi:MAG TPA: WD40 repeat domain-containing protein [Anaeromyxobacter sp.]|nr:WD40 repeat domain-containing protein [Anaeromyxobacter sp.]